MGRSRGSKNIKPELKSNIISMVEAGLTPAYVARFYNMPKDTVKSILRRNKNKSSKSIVKRRGRNKKLDSNCYKSLLKYVATNNKLPLFVIAAQFRTADGQKLSIRTIRRYLHKSGIRSYVSAAKPYLSEKHIAVRLQWCTMRLDWTAQKWENVAWTDESSFTLRPTKNHSRVWRKVGTRYETQNMVPTFKSGNASLCIWGMFSAHGRSPLVRISGTLNQHKYINILQQYVLPFKTTVYPSNAAFTYQHDGCGPHRAKRVGEFLNANGVDVLPWPAQSPDLNPIENVAIMKRRLRERSKYPTTPDSLFLVLCEIWDALPEAYFIKLAHSMVHRCKAVANVSGNSTKY